ncbi:hypothetical protein [Desulfovermiculus halophilus]|uniref:hypothetical protein n=1 Tax=Desulfovermiculus halophilus TaxID=339722 RepID=UPI0012947B15|nr:hypothetical protein [Desulfovermiculus halophilus]
MSVNVHREWMSLEEVWGHMMEDPYYGIEPGLITPDQFLTRFKDSEIWVESTKQDLDKLGRYIWINLHCPLCKNPTAWTYVEFPWTICCEGCKCSFRVEDYVKVRDLDKSYFSYQEIEKRSIDQNFRVPFPYDDSPQLRLLHIWHGLDGLPLYQKDQSGECKRVEAFGPDYIEMIRNQEICIDNCYLNCNEFEDFLLDQKLPLPVFWFPSSPVSTEQYIDEKCIEADFDLLRELNQVNKKIQEWQQVKSETVSDKTKKDQAIKELSVRCKDISIQLSTNEKYQLDEDEEKKVMCALIKRKQCKLDNNKWNFSNHDVADHIFDPVSSRSIGRWANKGEEIINNKSVDTARFEHQVEEYVSMLKALHS